MFNQLKSLFQLPGQLMKARQSEQQAEILRQKLQQTTAPVAPVIPPAVSGGVSAPITPPTVPPVVPPIVPPVIPPASPQVNPQIEAINANLSNLSSGLKDFSAGLTPPTPPVAQPVASNDYQSQLKAIQDKILTSSSPSVGEEELNARINALMGRTEASNILTGGEPISANAIAGRRESLTREQQAQLVPLQRQIGLEQAKRAAAIDVETKRAGFLEPLIKEQAEKRKPFELSAGQQRYEYNPLTGKMEMVANVAAKESMTEKYGSGIIGEYNFYKEQEGKSGKTPLSFDAYQTMDANRKAKIAKAGAASGLDWTTTNFIDKQSSRFDSSPIVKQFNEVQNKFISVRDIIDSGVGGPGDLALVFEFMKSLDPSSVVRESEYESAAKSGNIFRGWAAQFNGYFKAKGGFLPPEVKQSFLDIVGIKFNTIKNQYTNLKNETTRRINLNTGVENSQDFLTDYDYGTDIKESVLTELNDDIQQAKSRNDYGTREELIEKLKQLYGEFDYSQIANSVYSLIPDIK